MNRDKPRGRRVVRTVCLVLGCALLLSGGVVGWMYWHLDHNLRSVDIDTALGTDRPPKAPAANASPSASASVSTAPLLSGATNILVLGSDSRTGKQNSSLGGGHTAGARSDTAMVVHVNAEHSAATIVSIPRDTLVERPACPAPAGGTVPAASDAMFNSAYSVGGPVCAVKTVEQMTGVRMDHFVEVDFSGFADLVDALGGVTVTTAQRIDDDYSHLHLAPGTHHLDGRTALAFARTRHGIGNGSDLGRIHLQQQLVKALLTQISDDDLLTEPTRLYRVLDTATSSLTTDTGLGSLTRLAGLAKSLHALSAGDVSTVTMPEVPAPSDPNRVIAKEPAASQLWASLR